MDKCQNTDLVHKSINKKKILYIFKGNVLILKMNIEQYLTLKHAQTQKNYAAHTKPLVLTEQMTALTAAMKQYIGSQCIDQNAEQVKNVYKLLKDTHKGSLHFLHRLLYATVFNFLSLVLPVNGQYQYYAGTCEGNCGYGTNRVVAILVNQLIESNLAVEDVQNFPEQLLIEFWTAFKSATVAQMQGTGIEYNFKGINCAGNNGIEKGTWCHNCDQPGSQPPSQVTGNMFDAPIQL